MGTRRRSTLGSNSPELGGGQIETRQWWQVGQEALIYAVVVEANGLLGQVSGSATGFIDGASDARAPGAGDVPLWSWRVEDTSKDEMREDVGLGGRQP